MWMRRAFSAKLILPISAALAMLASSFPAWAALGGDISTIQADQLHMQGTRRMIAADSYTVHEIQGTSGTVVREYMSPQGMVFAVSWHGPWMPDLRQVLGSYYEQYSQAMQAQRSSRRRRGPIVIDEPGLSVQMSGHPRAFAGKAYVPDMLPSGVRPEDIQ
jgi:hypothetical protein